MSRRRLWTSAVITAAIAGLALVLVWALLPRDDPPAATPSLSAPPSPVAGESPPPAELRKRAQAALDEHLVECARSTEPTPPEHCGISIPVAADLAEVTGIRYRIEKLPVISLDDDAFVAEGGVLVATATGVAHDGTPRTVTYRTADWRLYGEVFVDEGEVDISTW